MADTTPLAPTDAEIAALRSEFGITSNGRGIKEFTQVRDFARAVLDKWGQPAHSGEPVAKLVQAAQAFVLDPTSLQKKLYLEAQAWGPLAGTSQPVEREPLTDEQIDAAMPPPSQFGIVQPPWCGSDVTILRAMARAIEAAHGIKGGQHGAE